MTLAVSSLAGTTASRVIQGTAGLGGMPEDDAMQLLDDVRALGCSAFDTAHQYDDGDSERVLGAWLRERDLFGEVLVITKGGHPTRDRSRITPFDIRADLEDSLARLGTETIDLYLLHRDDPDVPVSAVVGILNEQIEAGRIRSYGLSNWSHQRVAAATEYARGRGWATPAASSPHFSLALQNVPPWEGCVSINGPDAEAARRYYRTTRLPVLAWSSLAGGFFARPAPTGDAAQRPEPPEDEPGLAVYGNATNFARLARAHDLAAQKGVDAVQIALAYVLSQPMETFAIAGCRSGDEYAALAAASEVRLTADEVAWLEAGNEAPA